MSEAPIILDISRYPSEPSTRYIRADIVEEMRRKLCIAAQVFRAYQAHHEYKDGSPNDKSERNKGYAEQMETAMKLLEEE